ncbi:MAG: DUF6931 family protein [Marivita sp.]|uniref:DUF6931 family protein n=1 Tax=Marivita sp. TaxID=2003365 RepID=UPI003EF7AE9D
MLRKIPYETSAPVFERFALTEDAALLVTADMTPEQVLATLVKMGFFVDLVLFLAHGMPPREGVCWALAVQEDILVEMPPEDQEVHRKIADWVRDPQESTRILLMQAGEGRDNKDPVGWLCKAVAWNGSGSIGPVDGPVVLPPAGLYASGLLGAISLLAGDTEKTYAAATKVAYDRGMDVARGGWPGVLT